jgi:hypothetical protein
MRVSREARPFAGPAGVRAVTTGAAGLKNLFPGAGHEQRDEYQRERESVHLAELTKQIGEFDGPIVFGCARKPGCDRDCLTVVLE